MTSARNIEPRVGLGAREAHIATMIAEKPSSFPSSSFNWVEVHPENYMRDERAQEQLLQLRALYPLSLHGVGMSLVSSERLCSKHLSGLKALVERFDPFLLSEHLAWSKWQGHFYNDLLPVPMSEEALALAIERVDEAQTFLGRRLLIENPSLYGELPESTIPEPEFLRALAEATGCGLLLDINNVFVSANNLEFDAYRWLESFPMEHIGEIHLAGHGEIEFEGRRLYVDDHGAAIKEEVWSLADYLLSLSGARPILIERDKNIPALSVLCAEAQRAQKLLDKLKEEKWNTTATKKVLQTH